MPSQHWRSLNQMPAAFRKKTTDAHKMTLQKLIAANREQVDKTHRSLEEAIELVQEDSTYQFLESKKADEFTYCTLEGRMYMDRKQARQTFLNLCRQWNPDAAAQIITVWDEEQRTWLQLPEIVKKHSIEF